MKLTTLFPAIFLFISQSTFSQNNSVNRAALIEEVRKTEKQFETDVNNMGADYGFSKYAAPDAVIKRRNDSLITGPAAIKNFYTAAVYKTAKAYWTPDFIDVSGDGTLAYTYGKYKWMIPDQTGKVQEYTGVFHTIWKKQPDGSWKYVWD